MKVERSSLEQVKKRFEMNKKKLEEKSKNYDFEERVQELQEEVCLLQMVFFSRDTSPIKMTLLSIHTKTHT